MGHYEHKTKEELLEIVCKLEKKVEGLSSELDSLKKGRFRERYSTRILDALPDMLTVLTIMRTLWSWLHLLQQIMWKVPPPIVLLIQM